MTEVGLEMLKLFEAFKPTPYTDANGFPTIGYGHLIKEGDSFPDPLTESEGLALLAQDVDIHESEMLNLVSVPLREHQQDALASFVFNIGATRFSTSTLRRILNEGREPDEVADQFIRWIKGPRGLIRRRNVEAARFLGAGFELIEAIYLQCEKRRVV